MIHPTTPRRSYVKAYHQLNLKEDGGRVNLRRLYQFIQPKIACFFLTYDEGIRQMSPNARQPVPTWGGMTRSDVLIQKMLRSTYFINILPLVPEDYSGLKRVSSSCGQNVTNFFVSLLNRRCIQTFFCVVLQFIDTSAGSKPSPDSMAKI